MAQSKLLLDTNSYLRLAKSIHPLLFVLFGPEAACLYVLKDLDDEYARSQRLQTKFAWVNEAEYKSNRTTHLSLSKKEREALPDAQEFLWDYVVNELPGPSQLDCKALAYGFVLDIPVVTDDGDMQSLAKAFSIQVISSVDLLAMMLACGHIDMAKVRQVAAYWAYEVDLPRNFVTDYRSLFGEEPPT